MKRIFTLIHPKLHIPVGFIVQTMSGVGFEIYTPDRFAKQFKLITRGEGPGHERLAGYCKAAVADYTAMVHLDIAGVAYNLTPTTKRDSLGFELIKITFVGLDDEVYQGYEYYTADSDILTNLANVTEGIENKAVANKLVAKTTEAMRARFPNHKEYLKELFTRAGITFEAELTFDGVENVLQRVITLASVNDGCHPTWTQQVDGDFDLIMKEDEPYA